jgi:general L-amino acid transport system substrate-binding protein
MPTRGEGAASWLRPFSLFAALVIPALEGRFWKKFQGIGCNNRMVDYMRRIVSSLTGLVAMFSLGVSSPVKAGELLDSIRTSGEIRCGIHAGQAGLAARNETGQWQGFEIDLCRAWSAALFGNEEQMVPVDINDEDALAELIRGRIHVIALYQDSLFGRRDVSFAGNAFVDSLALMVRRQDGIANALDLDGKQICYGGEEAQRGRLDDFAQENRIALPATNGGSPAKAFASFRAGDCSAVMSERLALARFRSSVDSGFQKLEILPELLSRTLRGPVVASNDQAWLNVVRWSLFAMILAEEKRVSSENLASMASSTRDPSILRLLGLEGHLGEDLGLDPLWAYRIIGTVGNFAELYDHHFGAKTPTPLERGPNSLWIDGGLMRAPPFQ